MAPRARDARRLAKLVSNRRAELGLTQPELSVRSDVSVRTINSIEKAEGRALSESTMSGLDEGLAWESGSVAAILGGKTDEPATVPFRPIDPAEREIRRSANFSADEKEALVQKLRALRYGVPESD